MVGYTDPTRLGTPKRSGRVYKTRPADIGTFLKPLYRQCSALHRSFTKADRPLAYPDQQGHTPTGKGDGAKEFFRVNADGALDVDVAIAAIAGLDIAG